MVSSNVGLNGRGSGIDIFERLVSARHFQRIKVLFGVNNKDELENLIVASAERRKSERSGYSMWDYDIRPIENMIDVENIATTR